MDVEVYPRLDIVLKTTSC